MASLIPGFEYDVFISYRQKDNKHDGWVTEFVDNLKGELESMFKDEVSVYFDVNPSDYLLESYDVDASLKDKLKCLIFIPIISRTYCDPKSFAWDNELKAFVNKASSDRFGFKLKLPNGNFANRVIPIRIHDLDPADVKLFESIIGGVIRSIDFVYKETGVNRQLREKDDNIIKGANQILYRDQINKVALTIKDIIESMRYIASSASVPEKVIREQMMEKKIEEKEETDSSKRIGKVVAKSEQFGQAEEINAEREKRPLLIIKSGFLVPGALIILIILTISGLFLNRHFKTNWAKQTALTDIEQFINKGNINAAFNLVQKAGKYIPDDAKFKELSSLVSVEMTMLTDPPGADVYIREYSDIKGEWKKLGITPIKNIKIPGSPFYQTNSFYLLRLEKPGYENVLAIASTQIDTLFRKLFLKGEIPDGMVYVEGLKDEIKGNFYKEKHAFFVDRYEVTNRQFKEFINNGGYRSPNYWKYKFENGGKTLSWEEAMVFFIDKSGRPGPSTWEAGDYPAGQDDYPVSGVSWYEAAAYAEFAGKSLPTADHWYSAAGFYSQGIKFFSKIVSLSNFNGKGPEQSGKNQGITWFGAYDMAGNVREWCFNKTSFGHFNCGGGWDDPTYRYTFWGQLPSFDRSSHNGFRCVKYIGKEKIPKETFAEIDFGSDIDFHKVKPVPESTFQVYKNLYSYDNTDLKAVTENRETNHKDWIIEKITFSAAYGKERVIAYLYLPRNVSPPFQTLIFFPGSGAFYQKDLVKSPETTWFLDYILKGGRAVMFPVYKGTFERIDESLVWEGHQYMELLISWIKDLRRSIDYLETRKDIDNSKLGYYGHSYGGWLGGLVPAVEGRLKLSIMVLGGLVGGEFPETSPVNYIPRIKIPVLMLNGKSDYAFHYDTSVLPFYNLLGTPEKDKRLVVYETDHYIPKNEMIKEVLNWLDKYFGPVNPLPIK